MGFSDAYYIPNKEKKVYANGKEVWQMPDAFKKYQLLRTAALFGLQVTANGNKIMMSNGSTAIFIDGRPIPDYQFVSDMMKLRDQYNTVRRYAIAGLDQNTLKSKKYTIIQAAPGVTPEDAYPENTDPLLYVGALLQDLENSGRTKKYNALKNNIQAQISAVTSLTRTTTWGNKAISPDGTKSLADSLEKFFTINNYIFNRQDEPGSGL